MCRVRMTYWRHLGMGNGFAREEGRDGAWMTLFMACEKNRKSNGKGVMFQWLLLLFHFYYLI